MLKIFKFLFKSFFVFYFAIFAFFSKKFIFISYSDLIFIFFFVIANHFLYPFKWFSSYLLCTKRYPPSTLSSLWQGNVTFIVIRISVLSPTKFLKDSQKTLCYNSTSMWWPGYIAMCWVFGSPISDILVVMPFTLSIVISELRHPTIGSRHLTFFSTNAYFVNDNR